MTEKLVFSKGLFQIFAYHNPFTLNNTVQV